MLVSWLLAPAYALSCLWGATDANIADQVVPQNVEITFNHTFQADELVAFVLLDESGERIPITERRHHAWSRLAPETELAPGRYTLRQDDVDLGSFQVRQGTDAAPPEPPEVLSVSRVADGSDVGPSEGLLIDVAVPEGEVVSVEYQLSEGAAFAHPQRYVSARPSAFLGDEPCASTIAGFDPHVDYHVRVRTIDLAGNVSEWTDPVRVGHFDGADWECGTSVFGCSTTGGAGSLAWLALPLLALGRRRSPRL